MRYGQIRKYDIANGPGIRCSLFVTGCRRHCKGCFNEEYQSFQAGKEFGNPDWLKLTAYYLNPNVKGLTILGGEPFEPENVKGLLSVVRGLKVITHKSIWIYSGYTFEELMAYKGNNEMTTNQFKLLSLCDVLVDGPFKEELKDPSLRFRGSSNQRIIDIPESIEAGHVVMWEDPFLKEDNHEIYQETCCS